VAKVRDDDSYRWYLLVLAGLTSTLVVAMPSMAMPVLFAEISQELELTLVQIGVIWGMGSLAGLFTALLGGMAGDRLGTKLTLSIGCVLIGVTGLMRGLATDFASLSLTVFLGGFLGSTVPMQVHKTCGVWFTGRHLGLANGVVAMGMALGFMSGSMVSATVLSPWLGGWRHVFFFYGAIAILMAIPWTLVREGPAAGKAAAAAASKVPIRQALAQVVRLKNVWMMGIIMTGVSGCIQGVLGYLPLYLRAIGWDAVSADGALATFHATSLVSVIPLALLSDRLGSRKTILMGAALMMTAGVSLLAGGGGSLVWLAVILAGCVRDGFMAVYMSMMMEFDGVGATYAGTAIGLSSSLSRIGAMVAPALGNSLAASSPAMPFALWAGMAATSFVGFIFIREGSARGVHAEALAVPADSCPEY